MTALPPLRDLPRHAERRDELLALIAGRPHRATHARWLVPVSVAVAVALVAAGVVLVADIAGTSDRPPASTGSPTAPVSPGPSSPATPSDSPTPFADPPPSHAMSAAEMSRAFDDCFTGAAADLRPVFEPVLGYVFDLGDSVESGTRGWLVMRASSNHDDQIVCVDEGHGFGSWTRFGTSAVKSSEYLTAPVQAEVDGFGRSIASVETVTYAASEFAPEIRAIVDRGYWFIPATDVAGWAVNDQGEVVLVRGRDPSPPVLRGYDRDGDLVFDSGTVDGYEGCYSDPSGERVVDLNTAPPGVDPSECRRTYEWSLGS